MKVKVLFFCFFLLLFTPKFGFSENPKELLQKILEVHGGKKNFYNLRDVQYCLVQKGPDNSKTKISLERYLFEGENSYSLSTELDSSGLVLSPLIEEFFYEEGSFEKFGDKISQTKEKKTEVTFQRKKNYFWFSMPFKFLDSFLQYFPLPKKKEFLAVEVRSKENLFRVFYDPNKREIQKVTFFGEREMKNKILSIVFQYEEISGIKIAKERTWYISNLEGKLIAPPILNEKIINVQFWNGFSKKDFIPSVLSPKTKSEVNSPQVFLSECIQGFQRMLMMTIHKTKSQ